MATHYEILRVPMTSEPEAIEAAYKALIKKYHPDRAGDNARVRQINAAYAVLKDPAKRKAYDATLKPLSPPDVAAGPTASRRRSRERPRRFSERNGRADSARNMVWLLIGLAALLAWAFIFGPVHARAASAFTVDSKAAVGS